MASATNLLALSILRAISACLVATGIAWSDDRPSSAIVEDPALEVRIQAAIKRHGAVSAFPLPQMDQGDMRKLIEGEIVRLREKWVLPPRNKATDTEKKGRERHRVLAFYLIPKPRQVVWVAALDPHFLGNDDLTEYRVSSTTSSSVWYQHINTPWPVTDRHWVIDVNKRVAVHKGTYGEAWEQVWDLNPRAEEIAYEVTGAGLVDGIDLDRAKHARVLEENIGAWTLFDLGDNLTLAAYQLTIVMGGWIPDRLSATFAKNALKELMLAVEENTENVLTHYDAEHEVFYGGDGAPLPPFRGHANVETNTVPAD